MKRPGSANQSPKKFYVLSQTKNLDLSGKENAIEDIELVYTGSEFIDEDNHIYSAKYADVIGMILVEEGDTITIRTDGTNFILSE